MLMIDRKKSTVFGYELLTNDCLMLQALRYIRRINLKSKIFDPSDLSVW